MLDKCFFCSKKLSIDSKVFFANCTVLMQMTGFAYIRKFCYDCYLKFNMYNYSEYELIEGKPKANKIKTINSSVYLSLESINDYIESSVAAWILKHEVY